MWKQDEEIFEKAVIDSPWGNMRKVSRVSNVITRSRTGAMKKSQMTSSQRKQEIEL